MVVATSNASEETAVSIPDQQNEAIVMGADAEGRTDLAAVLWV